MLLISLDKQLNHHYLIQIQIWIFLQKKLDIATIKQMNLIVIAHEKHQKSQNMKQRPMSTEHRQKEHLKQKDYDTQATESSLSDTDSNMDIPAKKPRYSNYQTEEFDSNAHEKRQKAQKRE